MATQARSTGFPWGMVILLVFAMVLYGPFTANLLSARASDAAGRGMALGFAAIQGLVLWALLAAMVTVAILRGAMPPYAAAAAIVVLPLSAISAASATGLYNDRHGDWLIFVPLLLPPLLALYALWARIVGWHDALTPGPTTAVLGSAIVVLTIVPLVLTTIEFLPNSERDTALAAQARAQQEEAKRREQEAVAADAARFARLGSDSSLADYLDDLRGGSFRHREVVAAARLVKSRNTDAVALLKAGHLGDLIHLSKLDIDPSAVCAAYADALRAEAAQIVKTRSDHISVAIDLEWQLPNIEWLTGAGCDLSEALNEAAARLREISELKRQTDFADKLATLAQRR